MRTLGLLAAPLVLLAACTNGPIPPPAESPPPIPAYEPRPVPRDQCGAETLQHLVGQPRTEIPVPVDVSNRRVTCTDCPLTEDYSPNRLNILFDRDTELVERVYCG